jgi:hypothetical protein
MQGIFNPPGQQFLSLRMKEEALVTTGFDLIHVIQQSHQRSNGILEYLRCVQLMRHETCLIFDKPSIVSVYCKIFCMRHHIIVVMPDNLVQVYFPILCKNVLYLTYFFSFIFVHFPLQFLVVTQSNTRKNYTNLSFIITAKEHMRTQQHAQGASQRNQKGQEPPIHFATRTWPQVPTQFKICSQVQWFQAKQTRSRGIDKNRTCLSIYVYPLSSPFITYISLALLTVVSSSTRVASNHYY